MNNKESKITVTLTKALSLKKMLLDECKSLGIEVRNSGETAKIKDLFEREENLRRVSLEILKANSDKGNNERIQERSMLSRKREILSGILEGKVREDSVISKAIKYISGKKRISNKELERQIDKLSNDIISIDEALKTFNDSETIELTLIGIWKEEPIVITEEELVAQLGI